MPAPKGEEVKQRDVYAFGPTPRLGSARPEVKGAYDAAGRIRDVLQ